MPKFYTFNAPEIGSITGAEIFTIYQEYDTKSVTLQQVWNEMPSQPMSLYNLIDTDLHLDPIPEIPAVPAEPGTPEIPAIPGYSADGEALIYRESINKWINSPIVTTLFNLDDTEYSLKTWKDVTDQSTYWPVITDGVWNGTYYEPRDLGDGGWSDLYIRTGDSTWVKGFRPTHVRITLGVDPGDIYFRVYNPNLDYIVDVDPSFDNILESGKSYKIGYLNGMDIERIRIVSDTDKYFTVEKIEFLYGNEGYSDKYFSKYSAGGWLHDFNMITWSGGHWVITSLGGQQGFVHLDSSALWPTNNFVGFNKCRVTFTSSQSISLKIHTGLTTYYEGVILSGVEFAVDNSNGCWYEDWTFTGFVGGDTIDNIEFSYNTGEEIEHLSCLVYDYDSQKWINNNNVFEFHHVEATQLTGSPKITWRDIWEEGDDGPDVNFLEMYRPRNELSYDSEDTCIEIGPQGPYIFRNFEYETGFTIEQHRSYENLLVLRHVYPNTYSQGDFIVCNKAINEFANVRVFNIDRDGIVYANGYNYSGGVTTNLGTISGSWNIDMSGFNERWFKAITGSSMTFTITNPPDDAMSLIFDLKTTADITVTFIDSQPSEFMLSSDLIYRFTVTMYDDGSWPSYWVRCDELGSDNNGGVTRDVSNIIATGDEQGVFVQPAMSSSISDVDVWVNGIKLVRSLEHTSDGTFINILNPAILAGDDVEIIVWNGTPISGRWEPYFDNTFWVPSWDSSASWSVAQSAWEFGLVTYVNGYGIILNAIGSWSTELRPTAMRFSVSQDIDNFILKDEWGVDIVNVIGPFSANTLHEIPITGQTAAIDQIVFEQAAAIWPSYFTSFELYVSY